MIELTHNWGTEKDDAFSYHDGNMKGLAFIKDPDGYWVEILSAKNSAKFSST